mmetsp:Transcript_19486/g.37906  ORF Transcript_19486/g.37906 Transcript_19486/m.37906 type:complete len:117 (-) Transcript_19486:44-394(-)
MIKILLQADLLVLLFLIIGYDNSGINLFSVDPSGEYSLQNICALGGAQKEAIFTIKEGYRKKMTPDETILLAKKTLRSILKKEFDEICIEMGFIDSKKKEFLIKSNKKIKNKLKKQ